MVSSLPLSAKLRVCSVMLLALRSAWVWETEEFSPNPALDGFINAVSQIGGHHLAFFFRSQQLWTSLLRKKCQELLGKKYNVLLMRNKWRSQWVLHWMVCPPSHRSTPRRPSRHPSLPVEILTKKKGSRFVWCVRILHQSSRPPDPKGLSIKVLLLWHCENSACFSGCQRTCSASSMKTATPTASWPRRDPRPHLIASTASTSHSTGAVRNQTKKVHVQTRIETAKSLIDPLQSVLAFPSMCRSQARSTSAEMLWDLSGRKQSSQKQPIHWSKT